METFDFAMPIAALLLPPILILITRNRTRGFVYGALLFWGLMIVGSQYHLAYTPDYDSIAPGISIVAGWIPGIIYSSTCWGIISMISPGRPVVILFCKCQPMRASLGRGNVRVILKHGATEITESVRRQHCPLCSL